MDSLVSLLGDCASVTDLPTKASMQRHATTTALFAAALSLNLTSLGLLIGTAMSRKDSLQVALLTATQAIALLVANGLTRWRAATFLGRTLPLKTTLFSTLALGVALIAQMTVPWFLLCVGLKIVSSSLTLAWLHAHFSSMTGWSRSSSSRVIHATQTAAMMTGVILGPLLVNRFGVTGILVCDLAAGVLLLAILSLSDFNPPRTSQIQNDTEERWSIFKNIVQLTFPFWLFFGIINVIEPIFLVERFQASAGYISSVFASALIMNALSTKIFSHSSLSFSPATAAFAGTAMTATLGAALFWSPNLATVIVLSGALGLANGYYNLAIYQHIQSQTQATERAQGFLAFRTAMQIGILTGSLIIAATSISWASRKELLLLLLVTIALAALSLAPNKGKLLVWVSTALLGIFVGSSASQGLLSANQAPVNAEPVALQTISVPILSPISTLDPALVLDAETAFVQKQLYQTLYDYTSTNTLRPVLARSHTISKDGLIFEIKINTQNKFTEDDAVDATDVRNSIVRAILTLKEKCAWAFGSLLGFHELIKNQDVANFRGIEVLSEDSLRFSLSEPFGQFLQVLTAAYFAIVKESNDALLGSGKYQIKSRSESTIVLELKKSELASTSAREIHFKRAKTQADVKRLAAASEIDFYSLPNDDSTVPAGFNSLRFNFLQALIVVFNTKSRLFRSEQSRCTFLKNLRSALNENSIDWHKNQTVLPYGWDLFTQASSPEKSGSCSRADMTIRYTNSAGRFREKDLEGVAASMKQNGCPVSFRKEDAGPLFSDLSSGRFDVAMTGFIPDFLDPDALLTPLLKTGQQYNWSQYSSHKLDTLLKLSRSLIDHDTRAAVLKEALAEVHQKCPIGILGSHSGVIHYSSRLATPEVSGLGHFTFDLSTLELAP